MRSPFAYIPRSGPLQSAGPVAAVAYLGSLTVVAFVYSSPVVLLAAGAALVLAGRLAGAWRAVRAALWMGLTLALLIVAVNVLVVSRGETVLVRLGELPLLSDVITAEAAAAGAAIGLRAAVVMIAFAVYSACVDPDRVLRALRPLAHRSALTATLVSRLVPVAAADSARLRDAARLRGPGAAPVGRAPLARRLLAGSLDRAVDVAATLELRGYSLAPSDTSQGGVLGRPDRVTHQKVRSPLRAPCVLALLGRKGARGSRYDRRFYAVGAAVLIAALIGKGLGADAFDEYPTIEIGTPPATLALSALLVLSGLAPRTRPFRTASTSPPTRGKS
jgi:energy-coupling factor transport system permease protein